VAPSQNIQRVTADQRPFQEQHSSSRLQVFKMLPTLSNPDLDESIRCVDDATARSRKALLDTMPEPVENPWRGRIIMPRCRRAISRLAVNHICVGFSGAKWISDLNELCQRLNL